MRVQGKGGKEGMGIRWRWGGCDINESGLWNERLGGRESEWMLTLWSNSERGGNLPLVGRAWGRRGEG